MTTTQQSQPGLKDDPLTDHDINGAIRRYLRAYAALHGRSRACEYFGVSRYTLWRFLERGQLGRLLPRAVRNSMGNSPEGINAAADQLVITARARTSPKQAITGIPSPVKNPAQAIPRLAEGLENTLLSLCAMPLTTANELARFSRIPTSTLRDRLRKLAKKGLVDSVAHGFKGLGPNTLRRFFPTGRGVEAAAMTDRGPEIFLVEYPVSKQWFRLLTGRLDAVAVLYCFAGLITDADPRNAPVRVDYYRQGPYDMLVTLSEGRSVGILRQGATMPSANLRYRLRSNENLAWSQRPTVTLVITCSEQANRRAVRALGHPMEHRTFFVTTERKQLAGDHRDVVWQQCGNGIGAQVKINPDVSLEDIVSWAGRLVEIDQSSRHRHGFKDSNETIPDPDSLYPDHLRAAMPELPEQVNGSLAVQLSSAEKNAMDLLAGWPLCTTKQLAGLMGGVTLRRANQVISSLTSRALMGTRERRHVLTDEGLRCLAHRDRAAVRMALGSWSAERRRHSRSRVSVIAGTALRSMWSQLSHQDAITGFAAMLTAETARSQDCELLELLPTSRSSIGYHYQGQDYVVHPDATFLLCYRGDSRPYLLEVERRAVTLNRVSARLRNYSRYFASSWANLDHRGLLPLVLFVFETLKTEEAFMTAAGKSHRIPLFTSNLGLFEERGVLG